MFGSGDPPPVIERIRSPPSDALPPVPDEIVIRSVAGTEYVKDTSSPFWADVARMRPGNHVKYQSVAREWHVFVVLEEPMYGRPEVDDLSVVVRRVSTGQTFTMPTRRLRSCPPSFVKQDGKPVPRQESWRDNM